MTGSGFSADPLEPSRIVVSGVDRHRNRAPLCTILNGIGRATPVPRFRQTQNTMRFHLIDNVMQLETDRIVARKQVSNAEEYLADHFPGFPILPGVMMLEVMVQAARTMLEAAHGGAWVLGEVRALKYGAMVRPGQALEVDVTASGPDEHGAFSCRGSGAVLGGDGDGDTAISGRFTMRAVRVLVAASAQMQESKTTCS